MSRKITGKSPMLEVRQLRPVKFKDRKPGQKMGRNRLVINFQQQFGFMPDILIIDKVRGENNKIVISAVLPEVKPKDDKKSRKKGTSVAKGQKKVSKRVKKKR